MWPEPSAGALRLRPGRRLGWRLGWALAVLVPGVLGCNVAVGAGIVAVAGTAGFLASQCYDEVRIHVRDESGQRICDADVTLSEGDSVSSLRPCYHASLTEGHWRVEARRKGYLPISTEIIIPEHDGCPHYTHSVELTLRRVGAPGEPSQIRPRLPTPTPGAAPPVAAPEAPPATGAVPPPQPPTAGFPVLPPPGGSAPPPAGTPAPAAANPVAPAPPVTPPAPAAP